MAKKTQATDKDMLFSKLLPALNNSPYANTNAVQEEPITEAETQEYTESLISALRSQLFARSPETTPETYATINVMENLVLRSLDGVIAKFNLCRCDRCRCDVAACALNALPPWYLVADQINMSKAEEEVATRQVVDALVKAVMTVRANPRH